MILARHEHPIGTEKVLRHSMVKFGTMGQVVIEAVDQSGPRNGQMHLALPVSIAALIAFPKPSAVTSMSWSPTACRR